MGKDELVLSAKLTVYFEDPFWVGVMERTCEGKLMVSKVTFGAEPKDYEIQTFLIRNYDRFRFSPAVETERTVKEHVNPKRLQRDVRKQLQQSGIGTKSQQALKLQYEQTKTEGKAKSRKIKEEKLKRLFELKQQKRKEKHKGR